MMVVIIILGVISSIAYPMLFMNQKITTQQIKESAKRNDIRSIESFLKDDLRNCSDFVQGQPEDEFLYKVNLCSSEQVEYVKNQDELGSYFISRSIGSEKIDFRDIKNIELSNPGNSKLIDVKIHTTDNNDEDYLHELKIARWEWEVKKKGGPGGIYDFIVNENLYVMGSGFWFGGGTVDGEGATILIRKDVNSEDLNSNPMINVSNILIDGNLQIKGSESLGNESTRGEIIISKDATLASNGSIYGDLYVKGNLTISNTIKILGSVYVGGNLNITNGARIDQDLFVGGDLDISNGATIKGKTNVVGKFDYSNGIFNDDIFIGGNFNIINTGSIKKNVFVNGSVNVTGNYTGFSESSKVYHFGDVSFPGALYSQKSKFIKVVDLTTIDTVEIKPIPTYGIPKPRSSDWYLANGYTKNGGLADNAKIFSDSTATYNLGVAGANYENVVVVSINGDINIDIGNWGGNASQISGVFYAPNGKITIKAKSLEGLAIGKNGLQTIGGSVTMEFIGLGEYTGVDKIFASENEYPFLNEMYPATGD